MFLLPGGGCFAQSSSFGITNYRQSEGLPSNECYFIYRDSKNYLWFATDQGVVRFAGKTMEKIQLPDNIVFKITEDVAGRIWFFSQTGKLSYFFHEKVYPYKYNDSIKKHITGLLMINAIVRKDSSMFINSVGGYNFDISPAGNIKAFSYVSPLSMNTIIPNGAFDINDLGENFFATRTLYDSGPKDSVFLHFRSAGLDTTYRIRFDQTSDLQYGHSKDNFNNIYFYNSRLLVRITPFGRCDKIFLDHEILCINTDDADNIWVGFHNNGAVRLDENFNQKDADFFPGKSVTSIVTDYEKGMWFSTLDNGAYYIKDLRLKKIATDSYADKAVFRLYNQNDSTLYFATGDGIYYEENNSTKPLSEFRILHSGDLFIKGKNIFFCGTSSFMSMAEKVPVNKKNIDNLLAFTSSYEMPEVNDSLYFINSSSAFRIFNYAQALRSGLNNALTNSYILHAWNPGNPYISANGTKWITSRKGLYTLSSIKDSAVPFPFHPEIFETGVTCIREFVPGTYVIGLRFGGIVIMKDSSVFNVITEKEGLLSNSVKYILIDGKNIWAATAEGISVIGITSLQPLRYQIKNFGQNKGIFNVVIYQLLKYQNAVLAATSNGIYSLEYPGAKLFSRPDPLFLQVNNISCYKFDTSNISSLTLPYNKSRLSIRYSAICFNAPEQVIFSYRMLPLDTTWKSIDGNELVLENLQPGDYHVQIKAEIKNQQRSSNISTLELTIEKPWWQTNIFRAAAVLLLFILIFIIYKIRIGRIRKADKREADTRLQLSGLEQKALRSQMNPHFIFNCLTSIQQLIIADRNEEANLYLVRFSKLIRSTLENSATPFVSIAREQEYISDYVILEQLRFPEAFDFSFITDKNIDAENSMIPGMVLQPIVENSIRHGFKNDMIRGKISIDIKLNGDFIECTVTDNGGGYDSDKRTSQHQSYALKNIRQRLDIINGLTNEKDIFMDINNIADETGKIAGSTVKLKLPLIKNSELI